MKTTSIDKRRRSNIITYENDFAVINITSPKYGHFKAQIDLDDVDRCSKFVWHIMYGETNSYAATNIRKDGKKKILYLHRFVLSDAKFDIDHKDGWGLNCRKNNLRTGQTLTQAKRLNSQNQKKRSNTKNLIHCIQRRGKLWQVVMMTGNLQFRKSYTDLWEAIVQVNEWKSRHQIGWNPWTQEEMNLMYEKAQNSQNLNDQTRP